MSLEGLAKIGDIKPFQPEAGEISKLLEIVQRRLRDAESEDIFPETRLEQAYEAILHCATAALRACGYRASGGEGKHRVIVETLRLTVFMDEDDYGLVEYYQTLREKRHDKLYNLLTEVPDSQVDEALSNAHSLAVKTREWLLNNHPELMLNKSDS